MAFYNTLFFTVTLMVTFFEDLLLKHSHWQIVLCDEKCFPVQKADTFRFPRVVKQAESLNALDLKSKF